MNSEDFLSKELVMSKIYKIRDQSVMIDRDLAELYGVETKVLKQAIRRNLHRFPEDFMFTMTKDELKNWRSQFVTSSSDKKGLRYAPFCFTEQGVTMLSCVLNSQRAIQVNIAVIRIFSKMREAFLTHKDLLLKMDEVTQRVEGQDEQIALIFEYIKQFENAKEEEWNQATRDKIGFKQN
jgi:phage regulator Rha-like protein